MAKDKNKSKSLSTYELWTALSPEQKDQIRALQRQLKKDSTNNIQENNNATPT